MSTQYENLSKKYVFHHKDGEMKTIKNVVGAIKNLSKDPDAVVYIVANTVKKCVTFDVYPTKPASKSNIVKDGVSPVEAVSYLAQVSGSKDMVRQRAANVHRAFTEANVRECYEQVIAGIKLAKGWTDRQVHEAFLESLKLEMGETKVFDASALVELTSLVTGKKKSQVTPEERLEIFGKLFATVVDRRIQQILSQEGYNVEKFIESAKQHHFVNYPNRGNKEIGGQWALRPGSVNKVMSDKKNEAAIAENELRKVDEFTIRDLRAAEKKATGGVVINVRGPTGKRGPNPHVESASKFLKDKGFPDSLIENSTNAVLLDTATSQGWKQ